MRGQSLLARRSFPLTPTPLPLSTGGEGFPWRPATSGPYNQNLHWDPERKQLTCIQNVILGRGWRLDVLDLEKAIADGRASGPGVRVKMWTFLPHNELEGYRPLDDKRSLFITSMRTDNVHVGVVKGMEPRESPAGK